jgi:uncharacterized membrane protein
MMRGIKQAVAAGAVALLLIGGSLAGTDARANYTRTTSSSDGKVVMICTYDDATGKLLFCDVHYFPVH